MSDFKQFQNNWSQECTDMLIQHFKDGASASQSAAKINAAFGTKYTRNAVIGKRSRMGLKHNEEIRYLFHPPRRDPMLVAAENARRRLRRAEKLAALKANKMRLEEARRLREVVKRLEKEERTRPTKLLTVTTRDAVVGLRHDQCRYPFGVVGDDGFHFCQEVKDDGASYCKAHRALCQMAVPLRMKAA